MESSSQMLLSPLVDRDTVVSVFAPGRSPTEAPARTLRSHKTMSAGLTVRPRRTNRLAGQERMYSSLNLAGALLDRHGLDADARFAAEVAESLEQWAKANVSAADLLDYRATGRTSSVQLLELSRATMRLLDDLLERVPTQVVVEVKVVNAGTGVQLTEQLADVVLTFDVPAGQFAAPAEEVGDGSLSEFLASLHLPGAFDHLRGEVDAARERGDVVRAPSGFGW